MSLRINTNTQALSALRFLRVNRELQNRSLERLSSGYRINRAADDAAGMAISEKLRGNIRSMRQASRNAQDGMSLIQVAEGGMTEITNILVRMRELSIQAASDTYGDVERVFIDKEVQNLKEEIFRIAHGIEYNGLKLLNGEQATFDFQVGINNDPNLDRISYDTRAHIVTPEALFWKPDPEGEPGEGSVVDINTRTKLAAQENLKFLDLAVRKINENRSVLGALQNRLTSTINNLAVYDENLSTANSRIRDTDIAQESTNLVKQNILTQSNVAVLGQANQTPQLALSLLS